MRGKIVFERSEDVFGLEGCGIIEVAPVSVDNIQSPAQRAVEPEWPSNITLDAIIVPGTRRLREHDLVGIERSLAHQADRGARIAHAAEQRIRASQYFDVVEFTQIRRAAKKINARSADQMVLAD